jgi:PIN domain nuclease of toxin-antitoxin system
MTAVLLDTHAWVWSLADDGNLSDTARRAIAGADTVYVSPISFFEIGQKIRLGKWPQMEPFADGLVDLLREQGGMAAPLTPAICLRASLMDWAHRDPFDRLLAASATVMGCALVTRDAVFSDLPAVHCIW